MSRKTVEIEKRTVQDHDIVSSSRNRGCVVSSIIGMYAPSIRGASSSIGHGYVRVKDVRASLAISVLIREADVLAAYARSGVCFNTPSADDPTLWPSDHAGVWADIAFV